MLLHAGHWHAQLGPLALQTPAHTTGALDPANNSTHANGALGPTPNSKMACSAGALGPANTCSHNWGSQPCEQFGTPRMHCTKHWLRNWGP
eukprot:2523224-Lingulodinium_polyedra.AAC.1